MNDRQHGRPPDDDCYGRYQNADASSQQDLIIQEPRLSRPLPGSACLTRWATMLRSEMSRMTTSVQLPRHWRRYCAAAAALLAVTLATLAVAARLTPHSAGGSVLTRHSAGGSVLTGNSVSEEARLSQEVATTDCMALSRLRLANVTVNLARTHTGGSFTIPPGQQRAGIALTGLPAFCEVRLTQDYPPAAGQAHVEIWLPLVTWNGQFHGAGDRGRSCGISYSALAQALESGYVTASTDCGHSVSGEAGSLAPNPDQLASRNIRGMTVDGRAVTTAFYGIGPAVT